MTSSAKDWVHEPARQVPVWAEVDVCVLGGSATGVFAAVRAARLGRSVALVEQANQFGGTATSGLVNVWHSLHDTTGAERIIGGLTREIVDALVARGAAQWMPAPSTNITFSPADMAMELDRLVLDHPAIRPWLHTRFCAALVDDGRVDAVLVENKNGRGAIRAGVFIDATGDGDLAARLGLPFTLAEHLQPPTSSALLLGEYNVDRRFHRLYAEHREEFDLPEDAGWGGVIPGLPGMRFFAETHVFHTNAADADQLTRAEMEGRRQLRACLDLLRRYGPKDAAPRAAALCSHLGVRETRRFEAAYRLTREDVLYGRAFDDTIGRGTYRVDIHNPTGGGFVFQFLDGREESWGPNGTTHGRWREATEDNPRWYNIPYSIMVPPGVPNVLLAGRMISTDDAAFGALRVMVNLNQTGEAAGVAAALALEAGVAVEEVAPAKLRATLAAGGSLPG